jgi:hypothetical protein
MVTPTESRRIGRRGLLAATASLLAAPAIVRAEGQAGVALVIGNSKYNWEAALPNVRRDAPDMARAFQALGLKTELVQDADQATMSRALANLGSAAAGKDFAAFYFAGHGVSWERGSYIVPVDADLGNPSAVKSLVSVNSIGMDKASHRLSAFDNCRNNPSDGWRQAEAERGAYTSRYNVRTIPNELRLFSTAPGHIARDGPAGQNSPFAAALLRELAAPSIDLQSLPSKLRRDVLIATEGRQVLWDRNGYSQPFILNGPGKSSAGGGDDPSRLVELPNAYAYARENGMSLPSGLVANRPAANSPDSRKVGTFKFERYDVMGRQPGLLVVLSVEDRQSAEILWVGKTTKNTPFWLYFTAAIKGDALEFVPVYGDFRYIFRWRDANSGKLSRLPESENATASKNIGSGEADFTRLD